jgi:arsenite-transporting ATPase
MNFLQQPPRFLFFTGKGGVGKTSIACATAIELAQGASACCWSAPTRPPMWGRCSASTIGNHITPVAAVPGLDALEIDPQAAAQAYRDRIVGPVRGLLPDAWCGASRSSSRAPAPPRSRPSTNSPAC